MKLEKLRAEKVKEYAQKKQWSLYFDLARTFDVNGQDPLKIQETRSTIFSQKHKDVVFFQSKGKWWSPKFGELQ